MRASSEQTPLSLSLYQTPPMERSCALSRGLRAGSVRQSNPIFGRENDRPKLGMRVGELESHGEIAIRRVLHAHYSAGLVHVVVSVLEHHRLPHGQLRLDSHEPAVSETELHVGQPM